MKRGYWGLVVGVALVVAALVGRSMMAPAGLRLIRLEPDDLAKVIGDASEEVVVVNFWATWCPPCVEEFPDLLRFAGDHEKKGVRLILVSADFADEEDRVKVFLEARGVTGKSYLQGGDPMTFINGVNPDWSGALPATFIYGPDRRLREWREGKMSYEELAQAVAKIK